MLQIIRYSLLLALMPFAVMAQLTTGLSDLYKGHVYYLSHDSLEGRMTGSAGEKIASDYIIQEFIKIGLEPKGDGSTYLQNFTFSAGKEYGNENHVSIAGESLELLKDYYVMSYSSNGKIDGQTAKVGFGLTIPGKHNDYRKAKKLQGKIFIIDVGIPFDIDPHSAHFEQTGLRERIELATTHGASGVIFVNMKGKEEDPISGLQRKIKSMDIPVVFVKSHVFNSLKAQKELDVSISTDLIKITKEGNNVLGFINNHASETIVIGAHYDHLGWGKEEGSLYRGDEAMIHNGADDNASGVAMVIELARILKQSGLTNNNYLFMAFSGEELGLYGSKSYVESPTIDLSTVNYMINLDMVGRLNYFDRNLAVSGVGTSPVFSQTLEDIEVDSIHLVTKESGVGPSDHTSFYLKDIPVLHFFTGTHEDYHKPGDDPEKVNYTGMVSITQIIMELITSLNEEGAIVFTKTKEEKNENAPRFTVTLGVIPNYMFEGIGMKIDGVTDGKTASAAGIITGDIVIKMGNKEVVDMMTYMEALSMYRKGDKTKVVVKRSEEILEFEVQFK